MPRIKNIESGSVSVVTDEQAADLVRSGRFEVADGGGVEVTSSTGGKVRSTGRRIRQDSTLTPRTVAAQAADVKYARQDRDYNTGLGGNLKALLEGAASGATLGLIDPLLEDEATAFRRENNALRTVGEIGGTLIPAFFSGGASLGGSGAIRGGGALARTLAYTPTGLVSNVGGRIAAGGGLVRAAAGAATEGALGNAAYYLSDVALGNKDLSAEAFVGSMGEGAMWGGAGGAAFHGLDRGFVRARQMFPKLAGKGKDTAKALEAQLGQKADEALAAGDDAYRVALEKVRAGRGELQAMQKARGALDVDIAQARLDVRRMPRPSPGAAPTPGVPAAADAAVPTPGAGGWTDDALNQSGDLAEMLGQPVRPRVAEGSGPIKVPREVDDLAAAAENFEVKRASAREWIAKTRGGIAKKSGGTFASDVAPVSRGEMRARANEGHFLETRQSGAVYDEAGNVVEGALPDELVAWRRPKPGGAGAEELATYEDYNALLREAAQETDDEAREALLREAIDLEDQAFDASPKAWRDATMKAREKLGLTTEALTRRRLEREMRRLEGLTEAATKAPRGMSDVQQANDTYERMLRREGGTPLGAPVFTGLDAAGKPIMTKPTDLVQDRNVGLFVNDAEDAIKILGDYERAHADLVKALGPDAPPAAKALADEYEGAITEQARKSTDRIAQVADDVAEGGADVADPKQRLRELQIQKAEMDVELKRKQLSVREAQDDARKLKPARTKKGKAAAEEVVIEGVEEQGFGSKAADAAMIMEAMQTAGLGLPDIDKLPIIGPVLGLYLKARAAKSLLGRAGGRIPATAEARVARKAAATRDKVASSVDRMLGLGEKAARRIKPASGLLAVRTAALGHRLFDDGETREAKDEAGMVRARVAELAAAQANPQKVAAAVRRSMRDALDPDVVNAVVAVMQRKLGYLAQHAPKEPPPSLLGRKEWRPSKAETERFARRVRAAENPASVFEDLADGTVTPEAAEALREVYPELYAEAQMRLVERSAEITETLPYQQVVKLSMLFKAPLLPSMRPERVAALQMATLAPKEGEQPQPQPSGAAPNVDSLYMPAADKRAARR